MKKADALKKIERVVGRLERGEGIEPQVRPLRLILFGSTLKGSDNPNDIDLFLEYERTDVWSGNEWCNAFLRSVSNRKPMPQHRMAMNLRKGMKMIRILPVKPNQYSVFDFIPGDDISSTEEEYEVVWEAE